MKTSQRIAASLAYLLLVIGWAYILLFERRNRLALFHCRQAMGLVLFLLGVSLGWVVVGWLLAWLPYMAVVSAGLFSVVAVAWAFGACIWVLGIIRALRGRMAPLPLIGRWANRLPVARP